MKRVKSGVLFHESHGTREGRPLRLVERERPVPGERDLLLRAEACGVCRTDLHIVDGDLREARLPLVPGHEIVGTVVGKGRAARSPIGVRGRAMPRRNVRRVRALVLRMYLRDDDHV